eukprot:4396804-Lingulodinium_polyedra.AAC.1
MATPKGSAFPNLKRTGPCGPKLCRAPLQLLSHTSHRSTGRSGPRSGGCRSPWQLAPMLIAMM